MNAIKGTFRGLSTALTGVLGLVVPYITAAGIIIALVYGGKAIISRIRCRKKAHEVVGG